MAQMISTPEHVPNALSRQYLLPVIMHEIHLNGTL
jgi:hypothetical protein